MGQFRVEKKAEGERTLFVVVGQVDEDANFATVPLTGADVVLDLEKVSAINSCGIREWIKWVSSAAAQAKIAYRNCPKIIVDQINMVSGFLPKAAVVESFYVPYYSDESGEEKMVLFKRGQEFKDGEVVAPKGIKDSTGAEMEMDVIEAKYFRFLTQK